MHDAQRANPVRASKPQLANRRQARLLVVLCELVALGLAFIGFGVVAAKTNSGQTHKGEKAMTADEFVEALRRLDPNQEEAIDSLSASVEEQARASVRAAVTLLNGADPKMSERAASVVTSIGDLAIVPMLEAPQPSAATKKVWNMDVVLTAHLGVRSKVVARLNSMLADKMKITWGKRGPGEGTQPPSRVCDEAYLMMRQLLNTSEDKTQFLNERKAFLALSDVEKDNEILKAKKSHSWTSLTGSGE
jgi:hypothetical protein